MCDLSLIIFIINFRQAQVSPFVTLSVVQIQSESPSAQPEPWIQTFPCQVRVDSGIQEGSDISIYYDPMISKVSVYGEYTQVG